MYIKIYKSADYDYDRLFEIRRTKRAENHKDRQYCQVCRSGCPKKIFFCVSHNVVSSTPCHEQD
jgi:hypothetical protein